MATHNSRLRWYGQPSTSLLCLGLTTLQWTAFVLLQGHGRVALIASVLCTILGMHLVICLEVALLRFGVLSIDVLGDSTFWTEDTLQMALQWTVYIIFLCTFHLGEFFTTALFNPSVTTADSFMVNHSKAYSAAALVRLQLQRVILIAKNFSLIYLYLLWTRFHGWSLSSDFCSSPKQTIHVHFSLD